MSLFTDKALSLLKDAEGRLQSQRGLVGLDGYVDQIIRVVDKIQSDGSVTFIPEIAQWSSRIHEAAGKSTKFELAVQQVKLGGNSVIMANAMARLGLPLTCVANMGYPELHPVFEPVKKVCEVISYADACYTDALEFEDGKIMLSRQEMAGKINWKMLEEKIGREKLFQLFDNAHFIALDNWTSFTHMSEIWQQMQKEICPRLSKLPGGARRKIFFDLADPEFRLAEDIAKAMDLIGKFQTWYEVTLGLNQKEAGEICEVLKIPIVTTDRETVKASAEAIRKHLGIEGVVVHATMYAAAASSSASSLVEGPFVGKPLISTGAGDHFNAGYSLGIVLGGDLEQCLQLGVATSGYYVRSAKSPSLADMREFLKEIAG